MCALFTFFSRNKHETIVSQQKYQHRQVLVQMNVKQYKMNLKQIGTKTCSALDFQSLESFETNN